jgi:hypothetical protein
MRNIMNLRRFIALGSGFAAAAGLGLSLGLPASAGAATAGAATATRAATAAAGPRYVVLNCMDKAQVKPGVISLACADDGIGLDHLHWTSWTPHLASAYATSWTNDCKPSCAAGHVHNYPVVVVLWGSAAVKGHPAERRYLWASLSYTTKRHPAIPFVATYPGEPVSWTLHL